MAMEFTRVGWPSTVGASPLWTVRCADPMIFDLATPAGKRGGRSGLWQLTGLRVRQNWSSTPQAWDDPRPYSTDAAARSDLRRP